MTPISTNEKIAFIKRGKEKEAEFAKLFQEAASTTEHEDIYGHVDLNITIPIDVKSLKKINRRDGEVNEHHHWVELKGITGKLGWLYGKALFFAFELKDYWIIVSKKDLQNFIAEKCKDKVVSETPELYKLYTRRGRKDQITLVTSYDLTYIRTTMIKK